jgi:hypothetical protein
MVHDFLKQDDIDAFMEFINSLDEDDWKEEYMKNVRDFAMLKFGTDDVDSLVAAGKYEITHNWSDKVINVLHLDSAKTVIKDLMAIFREFPELEINGGRTIQRQQPGVPLTAHVDNHTDPSLDYAAVIYINDEYNDGEIFFTHKDVKIKPPAGSLLIFPTTEEYLHGVEAVGVGPIRYVMPSFIRRLGFYEENKF